MANDEEIEDAVDNGGPAEREPEQLNARINTSILIERAGARSKSTW